MDSGQDELLGRTVGNYRVARLLGKGGMGAVYLGVHPELGSRVAIKVITHAGAGDGSAVQRFFAEARNVNLVRHDGIVNVLDLAHLPDGRPYIVMEYVAGASLTEWLRRGLGARRLIGMGIEILETLAAAHEKGIVHRDLKPDNVMVTPEGRVKLLDFGIAKLRVEGEATQHLTSTGAVIGTPTYMSPEQALARPTDARSDLYSFGILLYQGLAGDVPFKGNSLYELLQQHVAVPAPALALTRADLPEALSQTLARTLAKNPAERPQSAHELRSQLLAVLPHVPDNPPPIAGMVASVPAPPARSHVSLSMELPDAWRTGATHAPLRNAYGGLSPSWNPPPVPVQQLAPATNSRLPWFLVGVSGLLLLVFAGIAVVVVAIFVLRQPAASNAPPAEPALAARPESTSHSPALEARRTETSDVEAAPAQQPESAAVAVTPHTTKPGTEPARTATASPLPTPTPPTPTDEPASEDRGLASIRKMQEAAKAPGIMKVESKPTGASVVFDGRSVGKAPVNLGEVPHGDYDVTCTLAGHRPRTYLVHVKAGTNTLICELFQELKIPTKL